MLTGLGADVVKVEPPGGDAARLIPPFWKDEPNPETGSLFLHLNTGKRSASLDLERAEDVETLKRLIAGADALIESFLTGIHGRTRPRLRGAARDQPVPGHDIDYPVRPDRALSGLEGQRTRQLRARRLLPSHRLPGAGADQVPRLHRAIPRRAARVGRNAWRPCGGATSTAWASTSTSPVHDAVAFIVDGMPERYRTTGAQPTRTGTRNVGAPRSAATFSEVQICGRRLSARPLANGSRAPRRHRRSPRRATMADAGVRRGTAGGPRT